MPYAIDGELIPVGGGDAIPLIRDTLTIGRRESADICWSLPNVSALHAKLFFKEGHWFIRDLESTNGVKVNGKRISRGTSKVLHPNDRITIGKRSVVIRYTPTLGNRIGEILEDVPDEDIFSQSLLERAGITAKPRDARTRKRIPRTEIITISHAD